MNNPFTTLILVTSISLAVSVTTVVFMMQSAPTIVTFDVRSTLEKYQQTLMRKNLSLEEQTARLTHFADIMNDEINAYHIEHNATVIVDAAVVGGAPDITPQIQRAIVTRYEKE